MYVFTPPTVGHRFGTHPLWGRINHQRGLAVIVHASGAIETQHTAPSIDGTDVVAVYSGGRAYDVTDETATQLDSAGYGEYLEVVA